MKKLIIVLILFILAITYSISNFGEAPDLEEQYCHSFVVGFLIDCKEELLKVKPEFSDKYIECKEYRGLEACGCSIYSKGKIDPSFENENIYKKEEVTGRNLEKYISFDVKENALKIEETCFN